MPTPRKFIPLAKLKFTKTSINVLTGYTDEPLTVPLISVLEVFAHHSDAESAFEAYHRCVNAESFQESARHFDKLDFRSNEYAVLIIVGRRIEVAPPAFGDIAYNLANASNVLHWDDPPAQAIDHLYKQTGIAEVSGISSKTFGVSAALARHLDSDRKPDPKFDRESFIRTVEKLVRVGLLTLPIDTINFGDFRRLTPFCPDYGFTRGTPMDRYYLKQFVSSIKDEVIGDVLEIGGRKENQQTYGFAAADNYEVMDLVVQPDIDRIGDAHDRLACAPESRDSVILFNVLEHCECPSQILHNIFNWLRPGGKIFCLVPNVQRVHRDPKDYWRIYPDAFDAMLSRFTGVRVMSYGNLLTSQAALTGICAEELCTDELDFHDSRYPVVTCAVAMKPEI